MVGDRAGIVAQPDAAIKAGGAQPKRPAIVADRISLPETDVVAPVGTVAGRLFEGEILGAALEQQAAHRRIGIGPGKQDAFADIDGGSQGDRVGGVPAGDGEGVDHLLLRADKPNIDRVAGNALRRVRHHLEALVAKTALPECPEFRRCDIGERDPGGQKGRYPDRNASPNASQAHVPSPDRSGVILCGVVCSWQRVRHAIGRRDSRSCGS